MKDRDPRRRIHFNGIFFDHVTPEIIQDLTTEELIEFIKVVQSYRIDFVIIKDLIKDRNDIFDCYNKLKTQLEEAGIKPCIDYYLNERIN